MPVTEELIRLDGGVVGYRGRPVLAADLRVSSGEVVAVLGPNGAGKSTLVKGVLGLAELLGGSLTLFGEPAPSFRERYRLGYVPQRQTLVAPLTTTVREVVATGRLARQRRLLGLRGDDHAAVAQAIERVGLGAQARSPVAELSGGQQRRALVARALASEAEVLILDEPLAGVDHRSRLELADTLAGLVVSGTTIVAVLHDLGPLAPLITRVVEIEDGRITFDGEPSGASHHHGLGGESDPHGGAPDSSWLGFRR